MQVNVLPKYDMSDNPTNCCPRFNPELWDNQELQLKDKLFVKAKTKSIFHIPLNIDSVFPRTFEAIENAKAQVEDEFLVLSSDPSLWRGEHLFCVSKDVPGMEMESLSGTFLMKVFEGSYQKMGQWEKEMQAYVEAKGEHIKKNYFFIRRVPNVQSTMERIM
jgi:hypothetical protein